MQGNSWIAFFRRVPVNLHDSLAITVTTGSEIVIQSIVRLDEDFAIFRGRLAGTQDNGRIVILPYTQLVSVAFNRHLKDADVEVIFGAATPMAAPIELSIGDAPLGHEEKPTEEPVAEEPVATRAPAATPAPVRPAMPSKSILLAKLRARLADGGGSGSR
jgi:hypothetical protein